MLQVNTFYRTSYLWLLFLSFNEPVVLCWAAEKEPPSTCDSLLAHQTLKKSQNINDLWPTREDLFRDIQKLHQANVSLAAVVVEKLPEDSLDIPMINVIRGERGSSAASFMRSLLRRARQLMKEDEDWYAFLKAAGIDSQIIRRKRFISGPQDVLDTIRKLAAANVPLNARNMHMMPAKYTQAVDAIREGRGRSASHFLQNLYKNGRKHFTLWDTALREAGLDPKQIRLHPLGKLLLPTRQSILDAILALHAIGLRLTSITWKAIPEELIPAIDVIRDGGGSSARSYVFLVTTRSRELFGSLDHALRKAHLDPNSIRLRRRNGVGPLPTEDHVAEWEEDTDGRRRLKYKMGGVPLTPQEALLARDPARVLHNNNTLKHLDSHQRALINDLLDTMDDLPEDVELTVENLSNVLAWNGKNYSFAQISAAFALLRKTPALLEYQGSLDESL